MISLPSQPKIIQKKGQLGIFEIEGLYPGYGVTIGNCFRRILLSSLEGAAVTQVKIKNVLHEFSTVPGVLEDVIMILLNIKKLRFKMFDDVPQIAVLSAKGEKTVKGGDFKMSSQVELRNPEQHIATLTKPAADLNIEIQIEKGVGYETVEERENKKPEVGVLRVDAIFTPVQRVSFNVEQMRVGKRIDFDRLRIEVETDGTVDPEDALHQAAKILYDHFALLAGGLAQSEVKEGGVSDKAGKEANSKKKLVNTEGVEEEWKKTKVEDLKISERTKNVLVNNNIKTLGGLLRKSDEELAKFEGFGDKAVEEVKKLRKKFAK